jgi:hypothetical protein
MSTNFTTWALNMTIFQWATKVKIFVNFNNSKTIVTNKSFRIGQEIAAEVKEGCVSGNFIC